MTPTHASGHLSRPQATFAVLAAVLCAALVVVAVAAGTALAAPPDRILSDDTLRAYNSMSAASIQAYLDKQPGVLKDLKTRDYDTTITLSASWPNVNMTPDKDGVTKMASQIIWEACQKWHINPKVMLTMLQKEQSLLTSTSPSAKTLARALGAGCPGGPSNRYPGFGNQVWHAARLLDGYGEGRPGSTIAKYYPGIVVHDIYAKPLPIAVHPYSKATYKLYVYNPSIGGNTSFWKIYTGQFGDPLWTAAPVKAAYVTNSGPIAYDLKSLLTTRFKTKVNVPGAWAELSVATPSGTVYVYKGGTGAANTDFFFPAWNGKKAGKRLPPASYQWTLKLSKGEMATTVHKGTILISNINFTVNGVGTGSAQPASRYMIAEGANCYIVASPLSARLTGPGGYAQSLSYWASTPTNRTVYLHGAKAPKIKGTYTFSMTAPVGVSYRTTVVQ